MPPKKNVKNVKNTTMKQKQKKAKQQQQQQQGQNVKININVGNKSARRRPGTGKKQPPKPPPKPPAPQIQTPQYVPMHIVQQPAQYFTPPVQAPTIPVSPSGTAISSIPSTSTSTPATATATPATATATPATAPATQPASLIQRIGQNVGDWLVNATIPSTATLPPIPQEVYAVRAPQPRQPTIRPATNINAPMVQVDTFYPMPQPQREPRRPVPQLPPPPQRPEMRILPIPVPPRANPPTIELDTFHNFNPQQNVISNLIGFRDLDEPYANSFTDYTNTFSDVNDWIQEAVLDYNQSFNTRYTDNEIQTDRPLLAYGETQTDPLPMYSNMGTQYDDFLPQQPDSVSAFSNAVAPRIIPIPPPLPPQRAMSPPTIPPAFIAPTQDIQNSAVRKIGTLTRENVATISQPTEVREYEPSEYSMSNRSIATDISEMIQQSARKRAENQRSIDEYLVKKKEEDKSKPPIEDTSMRGSLSRQLDIISQKLRPPGEEETEDDEWEEEELTFPTPKIVQKKVAPKDEEELTFPTPKIINKKQTNEIPPEIMKEKEEALDKMKKYQQEKEKERMPEKIETNEQLITKAPIPQEKKRKPGSGRPKGHGNKSENERYYEDMIRNNNETIGKHKEKIRYIKQSGYDIDEDGLRIKDYDDYILALKNENILIEDLIEQEKRGRIRRDENEIPATIVEGDENEEDDFNFM